MPVNKEEAVANDSTIVSTVGEVRGHLAKRRSRKGWEAQAADTPHRFLLKERGSPIALSSKPSFAWACASNVMYREVVGHAEVRQLADVVDCHHGGNASCCVAARRNNVGTENYAQIALPTVFDRRRQPERPAQA